MDYSKGSLVVIKVNKLFPNYDFLGANHSGFLLGEKIKEYLNNGEDITIDFDGFRLITSGVAYNMFANVLDSYSLKDIKKHVKLENTTDTIKQMINIMIKVKVNENRI